jgi:hypothetical protein
MDTCIFTTKFNIIHDFVQIEVDDKINNMLNDIKNTLNSIISNPKAKIQYDLMGEIRKTFNSTINPAAVCAILMGQFFQKIDVCIIEKYYNKKSGLNAFYSNFLHGYKFRDINTIKTEICLLHYIGGNDTSTSDAIMDPIIKNILLDKHAYPHALLFLKKTIT